MRKSKFDPEMKNKAIQKVKNGASYHEVAQDLKTYSSVVRGWCLKSGVKSTHKTRRKQ